MDISAFKALLEAQDRTLRSAMDIVVKQFQDRCKSTEGTVTELVKSLEFSQKEIDEWKHRVKVLEKENSDKKDMIEQLQTRVCELEKRSNYQEDYNRRNNLRISGLQEQPGETWEQTANKVTQLLEDKLQLTQVNLERAHRVGPNEHSHTRTIVARFEKYNEREAALRSAKKLKGTGIYFNEDLCPASLEIKKQQLPQMKQAREAGKIAYFRHTRLIIKDRTSQQSSTIMSATGPPQGRASTLPTPSEAGETSSAGQQAVAYGRAASSSSTTPGGDNTENYTPDELQSDNSGETSSGTTGAPVSMEAPGNEKGRQLRTHKPKKK